MKSFNSVENSMSLREKTVKNFGIMLGFSYFTKIFTVIASIILARILFPEDFGVFAIGIVLVDLMENLSYMGLTQAVVHKNKDDDNILYTAFYMRFVVSFLLILSVFFIAPYWGVLYDSHEVTLIARIVSIMLFFGALSFIPNVRFIRQLNFKKIAMIRSATLIIQFSLSVALAIIGYGVWSLVYGIVIARGFQAILFYFSSPWRFKKIFDIPAAKDIFAYSKHLLASSIALLIVSYIDKIEIGKVLSLSALGIYTIAMRYGQWSTPISQSASQVVFPALCKIKDDFKKLHKGYADQLRYTSIITMPILFGLMAVTPLFIPNVLGEKWNDAIIPLQILCIFGLFQMLQSITRSLITAVGETKILSKYALLHFILLIILLFPALYYGDIIIGCLAVTAIMVVVATLQIISTNKIINLTVKNYLHAIKLPLVSAGLMGVIIYVLYVFFLENTLISFIILILTGIALYITFLIGFSKGKIIGELKTIKNTLILRSNGRKNHK